jgi:Arc/MetJ-type ribon-helix-helix transcriptional regulator
MNTIKLNLSDTIATEMNRIIQDGWFSSDVDLIRSALLSFIQQYRTTFQSNGHGILYDQTANPILAGYNEAEWVAEMEQLQQKIDKAWISDKSGVEVLEEMREEEELANVCR